MNRRRFLKLGGGSVVAGIAGVAGLCGYARYIEPERVVLEKVTLRLPALPDELHGFKIVLLSDFHLHPFTQIEQVKVAVALANEQQPDLVALAGDYVLEDAESAFELMPALNQLQAKYGVFAVLGNHDYWTDSARIKAAFAESESQLLINQGEDLGNGVFVAGVDDCWSGQPDLTAVLDNRPSNASFTLLLAHEPDFADQFSLDGRVDCQLSGHSHGGQIRLPGVGALILPQYGRKYDAGLNQSNGMQLYTSRGIGVAGYPYRLNCPPEVTLLTLHAGKI